MHFENLRSPYEKVGGIVYFGRMLDKIRLHDKGVLPPEYVEHLGDADRTSFDARILNFLRVKYRDIIPLVLAGKSDEEILEWCFENGRRLNEGDIEIFNGFMTKRGWRDSGTASLEKSKQESGFEDREDIVTRFDYIDLDEGRDRVLSSGDAKSVAAAQKVIARTEARVYESVAGDSLPYRVHLPAALKADPGTSQKFPLLVFMHGAGERGTNNTSQLLHSVPDILDFCDTHGHTPILLAPQCPLEVMWFNIPGLISRGITPEITTRPWEIAMELIEKTIQTLPVDPSRVYITGISMGGFATWSALVEYPDWFAAAVPVCGGQKPEHAARIGKVPVWTFHGTLDETVGVNWTRNMAAALEKTGGNVRYTEYPGVGHDSWTQTFRNPEVLTWLFAQQK